MWKHYSPEKRKSSDFIKIAKVQFIKGVDYSCAGLRRNMFEDLIIWETHALFMILALLLLMCAGGVIYLRQYTWWFTAHKISGSLGALLATIGIYIAYLMVEEQNGNHITVFHAQAGLFTLLALAATIAITPWRQKPSIRTLHIYVARLSIILVIVTVLIGLALVDII
ncbi:MAG: hypothetical protein ACP5EQ_07180 [Candidatus Cloacimonadia bacterium]